MNQVLDIYNLRMFDAPLAKAFEERMIKYFFNELCNRKYYEPNLTDVDMFDLMTIEIEQGASLDVFGNTQAYQGNLTRFQHEDFEQYIANHYHDYMIDILKVLDKNNIYFCFEHSGKGVNEPILGVW